MNKAELIQMIAVDACITNAEASRALEAITGAIATTLARGGKVTLQNFTTFSARTLPERTRTNPKTKAPIKVPRQTKPTARFSANFCADLCNQP